MKEGWRSYRIAGLKGVFGGSIVTWIDSTVGLLYIWAVQVLASLRIELDASTARLRWGGES